MVTDTGMDRSDTEAPFNMALAKLELIHNILRSYTNISLNLIEEGEAQHMKYRYLKQLFVQAIPLFPIGKDEKTNQWRIQFKAKCECNRIKF